MSSLQSYYGLCSQRGDGMDLTTLMSLYSKGSSQGIGSEILPNSSSPPDSTQSIGRGNWATKELVHWFHTPWQKVEADPQDDPFCRIQLRWSKVFCRGLFSGMRLNLDTDSENAGIFMWWSSKWTFNHESFTCPLRDGLPKHVPGRTMKAALTEF